MEQFYRGSDELEQGYSVYFRAELRLSGSRAILEYLM
jgi:hypothetical protein